MSRLIACGAVFFLASSLSPAWSADPNLPFGAAEVVNRDTLAHITGKADAAMSVRAQNTSTVANNAVTGQSQTGTISFDQASFQNMAGLSLLSANTGNNVAINSSLSVNVSIQPK